MAKRIKKKIEINGSEMAVQCFFCPSYMKALMFFSSYTEFTIFSRRCQFFDRTTKSNLREKQKIEINSFVMMWPSI